MLSRSREIRDTLDRGSTRGALVLPPPARLHQVGVSTVRADAIDGLVPGDEVTGGIPLAAKERPALLGTAFDNFPFAAGWTAHANSLQERTRIPTLGEPAARLELAELA